MTTTHSTLVNEIRELIMKMKDETFLLCEDQRWLDQLLLYASRPMALIDHMDMPGRYPLRQGNTILALAKNKDFQSWKRRVLIYREKLAALITKTDKAEYYKEMWLLYNDKELLSPSTHPLVGGDLPF